MSAENATPPSGNGGEATNNNNNNTKHNSAVGVVQLHPVVDLDLKPGDISDEEESKEPWVRSVAAFGEPSAYETSDPEWQQKLTKTRNMLRQLSDRDYFLEELGRVEARIQVRECLAAEARAGLPEYQHGTLEEMMALPPSPPHRIAGLVPSDSTMTIVAQRKAGKTTLTGNLAYSLITGDPFLGEFDVMPLDPDSRVGILNFEVSAQQHTRWLADMGLPPDRVWTAHLRGCRNPFLDKEGRSQLAHWLQQARVETLIIDPFANAFTGDNPNDDASVTPFLTMLQEFARTDAGVRDLMMTVHSGWTEGRSRGSSRLEDWPDAIWLLRRDKDSGTRYLSADGRDVMLEEHELNYDPATRRLFLGASAGEVKETQHALAVSALTPVVLSFVTNHPGASTRAIRDGVTGNLTDVGSALDDLVASGAVIRSPAKRKGGGYAHTVAGFPA